MFETALDQRAGYMSPNMKRNCQYLAGVFPPYPAGTKIITTDYTISPGDKGKLLIVRLTSQVQTAMITITAPPNVCALAKFSCGIKRDDQTGGRVIIQTGTTDKIDNLFTYTPVFREHFDLYGDGASIQTSLRQKGWLSAGGYDATFAVGMTFPQPPSIDNVKAGVINKYKMIVSFVAATGSNNGGTLTIAGASSVAYGGGYITNGTALSDRSISGTAASLQFGTGEQWGWFEVGPALLEGVWWSGPEMQVIQSRFYDAVPTITGIRFQFGQSVRVAANFLAYRV